MSRRRDCLCAGVVVADLVADPLPVMPPPGSLTLTGNVALTIGGCAANVAADLAILGRRVAISGAIGPDVFGQALHERLGAMGVDCRGLVALPDQSTSMTYVLNIRGEDRRFLHCVGANAAYNGLSISDAELAETRILYLGGYGLLSALTPDRVTELFARARQAGTTTVLNVVLPEHREFHGWLDRVAPVTDFFFPNEHEARALSPFSDPWEQAAEFRRLGCQHVVVTLGEQGAIAVGPEGRFRCGIDRVSVVDGTGTGDAFVAGVVHGLLAGQPWTHSLRWGAALGASCVRALGATTGILTAAELADWIRQRPLEVEAV